LNDPFLFLSMKEINRWMDRTANGLVLQAGHNGLRRVVPQACPASAAGHTGAARGAMARAIAVAAFIGRHSFELVFRWAEESIGYNPGESS
jgi:hypothetical protein